MGSGVGDEQQYVGVTRFVERAKACKIFSAKFGDDFFFDWPLLGVLSESCNHIINVHRLASVWITLSEDEWVPPFGRPSNLDRVRWHPPAARPL
jgi:hypothetical protein